MSTPEARRSKTFPPVMRRGVLWMAGLSAACFVASLGWLLLRDAMGVPSGALRRYGAAILGLLPVAVIWPIWLWRTRPIRQGLIESEGRLCTPCAYDLSRLKGSGTCPECGHAYDSAHDQSLWEAVGARYEDSPAPRRDSTPVSGDSAPLS